MTDCLNYKSISFFCMALDEFLGFISQVGVRMLETAVWGTYYNVTTNLSDLKDQEFKTQASTMFENIYYKISISDIFTRCTCFVC